MHQDSLGPIRIHLDSFEFIRMHQDPKERNPKERNPKERNPKARNPKERNPKERIRMHTSPRTRGPTGTHADPRTRDTADPRTGPGHREAPKSSPHVESLLRARGPTRGPGRKIRFRADSPPALKTCKEPFQRSLFREKHIPDILFCLRHYF